MTIWQWPLHEFLDDRLDPEQALILQTIQSLLRGGLRGATVLEPGAGTGRVSYHLHQSGARVAVSDLSENSVNGSQVRFARAAAGLPLAIIRANLLSLPFRSNSFDLVWNSGVMEHFRDEDLLAGLREMRRVSRRFVAVFVPSRYCVPYNVARLLALDAGTWEWGLERPKKSLREEFLAAGLDVIDEYEFGHETDIPLSYLRLLPDRTAESFRRQYERDRRWQQGISLATIGVKRNTDDTVPLG
jgi:SAM-dependent methyltransferase